HAGVDGRLDDVLAAEDVGLDELEGVVLRGVDLLERGGVDDVVHGLQRTGEAALVADVTEEPAQAGVVPELVADLVLLQLVPRDDDDPSRVVVVEHFTQEGLAEGAGPTGDEDGGTVEERHADLFRRRGWGGTRATRGARAIM